MPAILPSPATSLLYNVIFAASFDFVGLLAFIPPSPRSHHPRHPIRFGRKTYWQHAGWKPLAGWVFGSPLGRAAPFHLHRIPVAYLSPFCDCTCTLTMGNCSDKTFEQRGVSAHPESLCPPPDAHSDPCGPWPSLCWLGSRDLGSASCFQFSSVLRSRYSSFFVASCEQQRPASEP